ncbi:hypothetical protein BT96DRAFT_974906 [Gymnopus androsaceus JB14]|uniref:RBR-type E3 ubiquitin transferase n=1 Tax=Gymnopus androsaceus JB14 TaxID=1447944 RepID=A0A6A4HU48_9AGAR|nr:hypothetical protein BT96DRAFT_974906 [Gymnopus androsaceus JB14]
MPVMSLWRFIEKTVRFVPVPLWLNFIVIPTTDPRGVDAAHYLHPIDPLSLYLSLMSTTSPVAARSRSSRNSASTAGNRRSGTGTTNATLAAPSTPSGGLCPFFARGQCRYGDRCKWRHESIAASVSRTSSASVASPDFESQTTPQTQTQVQASRQKPCFAFRKGSCTKGDSCRFAHVHPQNLVPQSATNELSLAARPAEGQRQEQRKAALDVANEERERKRKAIQEKKQRMAADAQRKEELELRAKRRAEDALALQQIRQHQALEKHRSDALVTIQRIHLGSTIVTFSAGAQVDLVVPGFETCRVTIRNVPLGVQLYQLHDFLQTAGGLENTKGKFLIVSLKKWNQLQEGVMIADVEVGKALTSRDIVFKGQSLKLDLKRTQRCHCSRYSVTYPTEDTTMRQLTAHITALCPTPPDFEELQSSVATDHTLIVRFQKWDLAKQVRDSLANQNFYWTGNGSLRLWLSDPIQYEITVPFNQYQAQIARWKSLLSDAREKKDINIHINEKPQKERVFVRVGGTDARAVGMLKVRVENLVAGEKLGTLWHRSFSSDAGRAFLRSLLPLTGVLVFPDWRNKTVKAYGESSAIEKAREAIAQEIERLAGMEYTVPLKRASVRFFAQQGVASLKERFGEDNVWLNISNSPCLITIRGGEEIQHALHSLIEQSIHEILPAGEGDAHSSCPICLDAVSSPVQVGCGHIYCSACMNHFLTADVKSFPVLCLGDETRCGKPIALPIIQKFLTEVQFNSFLESAFTDHIEKNPQIYKYCRTPDCERLYRCASREATANDNRLQLCCPSCFSEICSRCHEDGHEGMTCDERQQARSDQANNDELNAEWAGKTGVKKCPKCDVWIEKTEGCNHIECRCGAHICWRCMGTFDGTTIYAHMSAAHNGYGLEEGVFHDVDRDEQARALQNFNDIAVARRLQQQEPARPYQHFLYPIEPPPPRNAQYYQALDAERRIATQAEQQRRHRQQLQEQRIRDLEATRRRTRQEEGGNWCTIM